MRKGKLTFNQYQRGAIATAFYPSPVIYTSLKLASEAGEVAGKVGKVLRDNKGEFTPEIKNDIASEIGDVLWYCAALAFDLGLSLDSIATENLTKLQSRKERGVLSGSGDNR